MRFRVLIEGQKLVVPDHVKGFLVPGFFEDEIELQYT